jgi:hypothetical protein
VHHDLGIEQRDAVDEPAQVVVAGAHGAAPLVDRRHLAPAPRQAPTDGLGGRVDRETGLVAAHPGPAPRGHEGDGVPTRHLAGREAHGGGGGIGDPVDAEGAPALAPDVPPDQVPAPADRHERVGLHLPSRRVPVTPPVGEAHPLAVAARGAEQRQVLCVDRRPVPGGRRRRRRADVAHALAQVRGEHLLELDEGAQRRLLDPLDGRPRRRAQADGDRNGLVLVEQQRGHRGPGRQPVAPGGAGERPHRVAEAPQAVHVAPDGALGHPEPAGQLGPRPVPPRLQQREELEQAARRRGHPAIIAHDADRS